MKIAVKILVLPGINNKTIEGVVETEDGATLQGLFNAIEENYGIQLQGAKNCLTILDGEAISIDQPWEISLEKKERLWVLPMISGG